MNFTRTFNVFTFEERFFIDGKRVTRTRYYSACSACAILDCYSTTMKANTITHRHCGRM